jgi:hypothetical protein
MGHDLPDLIRAQHVHVRGLLADLDRQPEVTERILQPQLRARARCFRNLRHTFVGHQSARLRHLWPALRRAWPDGRAHTDRAWEQTRAIEYRMTKRQWLDDRDEATTDLDHRIAADIESLLSAEEAQIARLEGTADGVGLEDTSVARGLADGFWPTRAHPDVPRSQRLASLLHRPLALSDRVLDRCAHTTE